MKEFVINKFLKLKLEENETVIYVAEKRFRHCKFLILEIPTHPVKSFDKIESIDEAAEKLDSNMEWAKSIREQIDSKSRFWAHCSNIQTWFENGYDSTLLHRNLAFPLLKALVDADDPNAKDIFKQEIAKRLESGYSSVVNYLIDEGYTKYLNREEILLSLLKLEDAEAILELDSLFKEALHWNLEPATDYPQCRPYSFLVQDKRVIALKMPGFDEFKFTKFPEPIIHLTALRKLALNQNYINEKYIPELVKELVHLEELNLMGASLTNFPEAICKIPSLRKINFSFNRIHSIPDSIENLKNLEILNLSSNLLSSLPSSIGNLKSLRKLDLSNNKLSYLPKSIINLPSLISLELSHNTLKSVPLGIENISSLKVLLLGEEQLKHISHKQLNLFKKFKIDIE
ncbi:hypothetical protein LCGC14_1563090 [marine sediment metagenome]|uniref:Disease resistance R13L4/SHOC-2-like LRR domain-containing protein n=1 Tax=marine sediment metagenome TaxID=412755 RepID=A0A0F9LMK1_9ZZZZ